MPRGLPKHAPPCSLLSLRIKKGNAACNGANARHGPLLRISQQQSSITLFTILAMNAFHDAVTKLEALTQAQRITWQTKSKVPWRLALDEHLVVHGLRTQVADHTWMLYVLDAPSASEQGAIPQQTLRLYVESRTTPPKAVPVPQHLLQQLYATICAQDQAMRQALDTLLAQEIPAGYQPHAQA